MDLERARFLLITGWLAITVVRFIPVGIGWFRGEEKSWPRPMLRYMWKRTGFRDACAVLTLLAAIGLCYAGYSNLRVGEATLWTIGVALGWKFDFLPTFVLALLDRYDIKPRQQNAVRTLPFGKQSDLQFGTLLDDQGVVPVTPVLDVATARPLLRPPDSNVLRTSESVRTRIQDPNDEL
jgi:hypothetical protein